MRIQDFPAIAAFCGFLSVVAAVPAPQYCGVTTVFVTVVPTSTNAALPQPSSIYIADYGGIAKSGSASTAQPNTSGSSILGSGSGTDGKSTADLTTTIHQSVFLTRTTTNTGTTRTKTVQATQLTSSPLPVEYTLTSADVTFSSSSMTTSQATKTALGSYMYPTATMITQPSCSGDLVTCLETSVLNSISVSSTEGITDSQVIESTSMPPEVYVIETLTVIPLAALPTGSSSIDQTTTLTIQSTMLSTTKVILLDVAASTLLMTETISRTGLPSPTSISSSKVSYHSLGASGWNTSSSSSVIISNPGLASSGTGISISLAVDALSSATSIIYSQSYPSINFSNSYIFPNVTSTFAAELGFTASSLPSISSPVAGAASPSGFRPLTSASPVGSQTPSIWSETCLESGSSADALRSTFMPFNITASPTSSSVAVPGPAQTISEAAWTESYSKDNSATSTTDAAKSTAVSRDGISTSSALSMTHSTELSFMNSTSSLVSTTNSTTPISATSLLSNSTSLTSSSITFGASFPATTSSTLSTTVLSSSNFETSQISSSSISTPIQSGLTKMTTSNLVTSLLPTVTSSTSPAEDTCTETSISASSISNSSATTLSTITFTTLASSTLLLSNASSMSGSMTTPSTTTASSVSSSSPTPKICGEYGEFTLNFDDLPPLSAKDNSSAQPMPLFSPYHQFYFSGGWSIVPPPNDPYKPSSGRLLVEFLENPDFALGYTGAVGNGRTVQFGCFNFNAIGMSLGCNSTGPNCDWEFTGLRYNNVTENVDKIMSQKTSTPACPGLSNCDLVPVFLDSAFTDLTELRINVTVAGIDSNWWLDDLNLSWFDESCDAELCRQEHV